MNKISFIPVLTSYLEMSSYKRREGDWLCTKCKVYIFGSKNACRKCNEKKPVKASKPDASSSIPAPAYGSPPPQETVREHIPWVNCPRCDHLTPTTEEKCRNCDREKCQHGNYVPRGWNADCQSFPYPCCPYTKCRHGYEARVECYKCS